MRHVELLSETDLAGFRQECRSLLAAQVAPEHVTFSVAGSRAAEGLFDELDALGDGEPTFPQEPGETTAPAVPRAFVELAGQVILHRDARRFELLYGLLWRLVHEPGFRHDALDPAMTRARQMAQAVRRDMHKMTAFVRFRELQDPDDGQPLHVAWFEPEHHIVMATAPFFTRRFPNMRWTILTPEISVRWDGRQLQEGPGASRDDAPPPDANEALWLVYYQHIFNPARLKVDAMQKEMPRKYWRNLPEAALIEPLIARAQIRNEAMIETGGALPPRAASPTARSAPVALPIRDVRLDGKGGAPEERLKALHASAARCRECPIGEYATQVVWGEGPSNARLMVVGEQPGDQEDLQGRPFVGPSGQLFDRAVSELGWARERLYVSNAVKHFKFELRGRRRIHKTPTQREAAACLHWLDDEIDAVRPDAFIALGATAARSLMGRQVTIMRERGRWLEREDGRRVLATLHPSALLRLLDDEREAAYAQWLQDLRVADSLARQELA